MHPWTLSFADFIYFLPCFACQIIWYLHLICKLITWCMHFAASAVGPFYKEIRFLEFSGLLIFYPLCWLRWWFVFSMQRRICKAYKNTTAQWCAMLSFVLARMVECPCEKFDTQVPYATTHIKVNQEMIAGQSQKGGRPLISVLHLWCRNYRTVIPKGKPPRDSVTTWRILSLQNFQKEPYLSWNQW